MTARIAAMKGLEVRLLGRFEALVDGRAIKLTNRECALLAVLSLSVGGPVNVERIAAALWGHDQPRRPEQDLRVCVTRLRQRIGQTRIITRSGTYLLDAEPDAVDVVRFKRLASVQPGTANEASELAQALQVWRGEPFETIRPGWLAEFEGPGLIKQYLTVLERSVELELAAGRTSEMLATLSVVTSKHPDHEALWALRITALMQAGRKAEALQAFELIRGRLAADQGAVPNAQLRKLHAELLATDRVGAHPYDGSRLPRPAHPAAGETAVSKASPYDVPRQLPTDLATFVGRTREQAILDEILLPESSGEAPVVAICGAAGVGKSALVAHWAHRARFRFPDGELYLNLHGYGPAGPIDPADALVTMLMSLGLASKKIPAGTQNQSTMLSELLAGLRLLLVLDNARDATQLTPLLRSLPPTIAIIVTSREMLRPDLAASRFTRVDLGPFSQQDSVALLNARVSLPRLEPPAQDQERALRQLADLCGNLPLALAIVAERLKADLRADPSALVDLVAGASTTLDVFETSGDDASSLREILSWSYDTLDPKAAQLFRFLALNDGVTLGLHAASALAGLPVEAARGAILALVNRSLAFEPHPGRVGLHDLIRLYAAERLAEHAPVDLDRALDRMHEFYLHTANYARPMIKPGSRLLDLGPVSAEVEPLRFVDEERAMAWFTAEREAMVYAVRKAAERGNHRMATNLVRTMWELLLAQGRLTRSHCLQRFALDNANRTGDASLQAAMRNQLGVTTMMEGDYPQALRHLRAAAEFFEQAGDLSGLAPALNNLGLVYRRLGLFAQAADALERAADHFTRIVPGESAPMNNLALTYLDLQSPTLALAAARRALAITGEAPSRPRAYALDTLGQALAGRGDHAGAIAAYEHALALRRQLHEPWNEAISLVNLARAQRASGWPDEAHHSLQRALRLYDEAGDAVTSELPRDAIVEQLAAVASDRATAT